MYKIKFIVSVNEISSNCEHNKYNEHKFELVLFS